MATTNETISQVEKNKKPQKKYYRQRAHTNPLADHSFQYAVKPSEWKETCCNLYDLSEDSSKKVTFADIGCGYGGLLVSLSTMYPNNLALGMEIRVKVSDYVIDVSQIIENHRSTLKSIVIVPSFSIKICMNMLLFYF